MRRLSMTVLLCASLLRVAWAAPPDPSELAFRQHLGAAIPTAGGWVDQDGRPARLADYLGKGPVILVLGYYHCPVLCSTVMDGVLERARGIGVPYEVVAASIDPTESPADAARKYAYYRGLMAPDGAARLHLLTGTGPAIADLARVVGFPYRRDPDTRQYFHPAGFVIVTPGGRISRYILGVGYAARDVRLALVEASAGKVGSLADRLVLLCSHYDARTGRYNVAAMAMARAAGLGALAALLAGLFFLRRRARRETRP